MEGGHRLEAAADGPDPIDDLPAEPEPEPADPWEGEWRNAILDLALERVRSQVEPSSFEALRDQLGEP
jgi:hypothetical protein